MIAMASAPEAAWPGATQFQAFMNQSTLANFKMAETGRRLLLSQNDGH